MNILIIGKTISNGYSGGRYHAFILALSLAKINCKVTFYTQCKPFFLSDFKKFDMFKNIKFNETLFSLKIPKEKYDAVIVIPDANPFTGIYEKAVIIAKNSNAKLLLINFETPNWFNSLAIYKRSEFLWSGCKFVSKYADGIISSTNTGNYFAKLFYKSSMASFTSIMPAVNELQLNKNTKLKKKFLFTAILKKKTKYTMHKSIEKYLNIFERLPSGSNINIIGDIDKKIFKNNKIWKIKKINFFFNKNIDDKKKFDLIKESHALLFISEFEGFGYPPVESICLKVPVFVNNLKVFKETLFSSEILINKFSFKNKKNIFKSINKKKKILRKINHNLIKTYSFLNYGKKFYNFIKKIKKNNIYITRIIFLRFLFFISIHRILYFIFD